MGQTTDVFVIGGGPVGLAVAIAARQKGFEVVVADSAEPPIDKACGEGLMPDTVSALRTLGVPLTPAQGFAFRGIRFVGEDARVDANFPSGQGIGLRRPVLHQKMIERAEKLGITLCWKTPVTGISAEGVLAGGRTISARWMVGADGIRSRVRRWCGLESPAMVRPRYAFRRHYRVAPWTDCAEIYWGWNTQAYVTPVGRNDVCVVLISRRPGTRSTSITGEFPELADRLSSAEGGPERGAVTLTCGFDRVYRGRVALVGDASGSVDAITGEGLCLGFHQAGALAEAFERNDLSEYQMSHRRLARRPTAMGRLLLMLDSHSGTRRRALHALAKHPELFARILAVHVGSSSPAQLAMTAALLSWRFVLA
ncbi:MAG TPA: NAD(P)/FAD-dependent oxidoreductase [Candidatus Acidoferrum sp.]|nr:NAD(P)/FAD-dependent oxidoreductase [Candidatus Acidoferrum sp.]